MGNTEDAGPQTALTRLPADRRHRIAMPPDRLTERIASLSPAKRALLDQRLSEGEGQGNALLARALAAAGVTHVYGIPAIPIYGAVAACAAEGIRVLGTRHQQAAALMAAAQNYVAGRQVAAVLVSTGAAAGNALTGALVARDNCWPLVILVGAVPHDESFSGQFMSLDHVALYRSITKSASSVESPADIAPAVARACDVAMSGRPGPVLLELPADVLSRRAHFPMPPGPVGGQAGEIAAGLLDAAAERLLAAKRPLLVIGKGTRWAEPFAALAALVDRASLPFVTSPIARGYLPDTHPLCFNDVSWAAQRDADLAIVLGARLDWTFRYGTGIGRDAFVIQVDIHAGEIGRNRAAQMGIQGDAGAVLHGLLARIPEEARKADAHALRRPWIEDLERRREQAVRARKDEVPSNRTPIAPQTLARSLAAALPENAMTVLDGNLVMAACESGIPVNTALGRLTPGTSGCMGVGIPFAIGAKLQCPDRPVVAICGDFAFGLSAFELETAVRHDVPIVVVVANNDGNAGTLRQRTMFPAGHTERVAMFQPGIRYEKIVEAFGGHGEHVQSADEIGPALRRSLACGKPACISVAIDPNAPFPRR